MLGFVDRDDPASALAEARTLHLMHLEELRRMEREAIAFRAAGAVERAVLRGVDREQLLEVLDEALKPMRPSDVQTWHAARDRRSQ